MEESVEIKTSLSSFDDLKIGDCLSHEVVFLKVVDITEDEGEDIVILEDEHGERVDASREYVELYLHSGNQFESTIVVTRTEAVEILKTHPHVAMTVNYFKQPKVNEVISQIMETYNSSTPKEFEDMLQKSVKQAMHGEERTIVGRIASTEGNEFGRFYFIDMNIERDDAQLEKDREAGTDSRLRLVDSRSINFIIVKGIKYIVKK